MSAREWNRCAVSFHRCREPRFNPPTRVDVGCLHSEKHLTSVMNSDDLSRTLDKSKGLQDYVRLSFNDQNPMRFKSQNRPGVTKLVMLQVKLEVVSRPNVLFCDRNATRREAIRTATPTAIQFDVVKAKSQYAVNPGMKHLYQAEVLVPSPVPAHLVLFPDDLEASKIVKAKSVYKAQKSARATSVMISTSVDDSLAAAPSGHPAGARKLVGTLSNSAISNWPWMTLLNCLNILL